MSWKIVLGLVALAAVIVASIFVPVRDGLTAFVEWVRGAGVLGFAVYTIVFVACVVLFLPTIQMFVAAGLLYGTWWGALITTVLAVASGMLAFALARNGLRSWVERRLAHHESFAAIDHQIGKRSFWIATLLRLSPAPLAPLNYALAATKISAPTYAASTLVGMLPGDIVLAYAGTLLHRAAGLDDASAGAWTQLLLWGGIAAALVASTLVGLAVKRALQHHAA